MTEPLVDLRRVTKRFGNQLVVHDVSFGIAQGEFFSILGSSGCGKSTTLRLIAGFETPDGGEIQFDGEANGGVPAYVRHVNMVFQNYALFPHLTVSENIGFGLRMARMDRAAIRRTVGEMLELVRLQGHENKMPAQLSGGQQQRVALARALATQPRVVLLDEPLGALDLKLRREMQQELKRIHEERSLTFVYVTHDQEEALTMSDRVCVMHEGRAVQIGTPEEIYDRPRNRFVAGFIGETNFLRGTVVRGGHGRVSVSVDSHVIDALPPAEECRDGDVVWLAIRPERIRLMAAPADEAGVAGGLRGTVERSIFCGSDRIVEVRLESGAEMRVRTGVNEIPGVTRGAAVTVSWPVEAAAVVSDQR